MSKVKIVAKGAFGIFRGKFREAEGARVRRLRNQTNPAQIFRVFDNPNTTPYLRSLAFEKMLIWGAEETRKKARRNKRKKLQ